MQHFGPLHLGLLAVIAVVSAVLALALRRGWLPQRATRLALGWGLAVNELIWWTYRYSHEGFRFPVNLPLQLCDVAVWTTVAACLTLRAGVVEFAYFVGIAGAGMALVTPDLWAPWPQYPAVYFFLAHGLIVAAVVALVFGRVARLRPGAVTRSFGRLAAFAAFVGTFNAVFGTNYMYLRAKPAAGSLLDVLGPWPWYLVPAALLGYAIFWLLWLPARAGR